MKGQFSLFSNIFEDQPRSDEKETRPRNYFMPLRNEAIAYRYYYYAQIKYIRYDKCLEFLEQEFYLTEARLIVVLSTVQDKLTEINKEKPTVRQLQKKIPHFNWAA